MPLEIRSPEDERSPIVISDEAADLNKLLNGTVCSRQGDEYEIRENIIDLLTDEPEPLTWVQSTNHWGLTAALYEEVWRERSLSILTGKDFPVEEEQKLFVKWLNMQPGDQYLDIGCSTGLYGRFIKSQLSDCVMVSLDFSSAMLKEARKRAAANNSSQYLLRADARHLPFFSATFDGLTMGGTLNELKDPLKVLYEARRIIKKEGVFYMMHLLKADTWYAKMLQNTTTLSGLSFWSIEESNHLFDRAGFKVTKQFDSGMVCFTRLVPA